MKVKKRQELYKVNKKIKNFQKIQLIKKKLDKNNDKFK